MSNDIIAVRDDEKLNEESLFAWLQQQNLPGADVKPAIRQFAGGKANLTYLLEFPTINYVLRRPPFGPLPKGAHDMAREFKVLSRLHEQFPAAPRAHLFCDDPEIIGADFFIMDFRQGVVVRTDLPATFAHIEAAPMKMSCALIDALADFHKVNPDDVGLADLGKADGFVTRQIHGWYKRWTACETSPDKRMKGVYEWLQHNQPQSQQATLVHNDFKLDNAMLSESDPSQLTSVFDWDMCTLGDPLSDLGTLLTYWHHIDDNPKYKPLAMMPSHEGFPSRQFLVKRYAEKTGFDLSQARFYHVLGLYRLAVILEQIYARFHHGHTQDQRFSNFGELARLTIEWAQEVSNSEV